MLLLFDLGGLTSLFQPAGAEGSLGISQAL